MQYAKIIVFQYRYTKNQDMKIINLFIIALFLGLCMTQDQGDWVDPYMLPIGFPVHPFYAGYLPVGSNRQYFYVYHPSQGNPNKDPLIVRVSPGPGCSSLYSWLYSKGPFVFTPNTHDFRINKHNWNKQANLLFIEGPTGVGFTTDKSGVKRNMTDQQYVDQMLRALFSFYNKFKQLKDQDIYLSGEQYAGITIPMMAKQIIQHNNSPYTPIWQRIKLRGFILQNPCTLADECDSHFEFTPYTMQFLKNHYFISKEKYAEYIQKCTRGLNGTDCTQMKHHIQANFINTGSDRSNIYRECVKQTGPEKYKCLDIAGILLFMNNKHVQEDIHADPSVPQWDLCNLDIWQGFKRTKDGSLHVYQTLLRQQRDLRIWIVSGTLSASVPTLGTRRWIESLKMTLNRQTRRIWSAWKYDKDVNAGQIQQFRGLTFLTVRSAGSMLYRDQPEIGYHIIDSFLKGKSL